MKNLIPVICAISILFVMMSCAQLSTETEANNLTETNNSVTTDNTGTIGNTTGTGNTSGTVETDTSETTLPNVVTTAESSIYFGATGNAVVTGSLSNGYTYILPSATSAQWQAQLFLATDADITSGEKYAFSVKLKSTVAMSNVTVKFDHTSEIYYCNTISLEANVEKEIAVTATSSVSVDNITFVFDFGNNAAGTVKIYDLSLTKPTTTSSGSSNANVDTTSSNVGASGTEFEASTPSNASSFDTIVWSDEFNGTSLDTTNNWVYETGNNNGWGNSELENYTAGDNLTVADGMMKITAKSDLTSTRIKTQDKKYFKYGKVVAKLKCDQGAGSWPAFWMLGQNMSNSVPWPYCGEIDIMEHANTDYFTYATCHWNSNGSSTSTDTAHASWGQTTNNNYYNNISTLDITEWHEYAIIWTDTAIDFYIDDTKVMAMAIGDSSNGTDAFNKDFFILFNFAMGGQFTGIYNSANFVNMPWNMYVDYVRVYQ